MARTWIPVRDLEAGNVPAVCAKTGASTETLFPMDFSSAPPWCVSLILFGVPFRSPTAFGTRQVKGFVPLRQDVHRHLDALASSRWWAALIALILMLLGVGTALVGAPPGLSRALAWAGVSALGCAGVLATFSLLRSVTASIDPERGWVRLSGVHPRFAAAVEADYAIADLTWLVRGLRRVRPRTR